MKGEEFEFGGLYGNVNAGTYEVAVFLEDQMVPLAAYDDVIGWLEEGAITKLMYEFQTNGVVWLKLLIEIREEHNKEMNSDH